ncbi:RELT-like protein 2 isoform X1 [Pantherophis guttatus]|uniref:LOW QUALITY PROTEIN: RELT-like protein 2 n=1 Tax=Pantherophis guttatus TaxID=94885 RepID=A0A6P9B9P0_PANGU|nr:RELT-like protein 2 isoform X1 [Pantherophis guttatus]XP_034264726.1 RELT-like protein 2 isoform X1 [Pantherophis guttatus]XP_034264727.1 RELT-like protein 2 isoform X1 [Pantherophis guttatus]XP_060542563.1 LOW QUALITY PROTEIN: RELT-like protein 2 [Pantherophis guttatus]XP_060542773.1 RELT-like protein 2 isoform X1 [Pantherophis guttatus]
MSEHSSTTDGDVDPQHGLYMLILLILVFFVMGLAGFLICHILKKKGYRCRTFSDEFDFDNKESLTQLQDDDDEDLNEDTVEKIVKCIIQNEANVEVLKEMLGESDADLPLPVPVPSALCPHRSSQDGGIPHHHTVHLGSTQAPCIHCSKKKRPPIHRQGRLKESKSKMHPGETTVFSVGRFRVTHIEKKTVSHESQEESFHENKPDVADTNQETYSNEKLQWTGSQNGIVHTDGVQERKLVQPDSERPPKETTVDDLTHLNLTANTNIAINETEGGYPKAHSSQEAINSAASYATETNSTPGPKDLSSEELEEDKKAEQMGHQRVVYEVSDNKQGQVLSIGPELEICSVEQVA